MGATVDPPAEALEEIERLRKELEEARERIRLLEALRDDLVGLMAHDLRSPFAVIRGLAEILRDGSDEDPEEAADFLDRILANADLGIRLAANAVEAVRSEGQRLQATREPVDVAGLVDGVVDRFDALARVRHVSIVRRADPALPPTRVDPEMIDRALSNLLAHGLQASPRDSRIAISIDRSGDGLVITLRGDGFDLPEAERRRLLGNGGEGCLPVRDADALALHLVKRQIEAHGGAIGFESVGGGTLFTLRLPGVAAPPRA